MASSDAGTAHGYGTFRRGAAERLHNTATQGGCIPEASIFGDISAIRQGYRTRHVAGDWIDRFLLSPIAFRSTGIDEQATLSTAHQLQHLWSRNPHLVVDCCLQATLGGFGGFGGHGPLFLQPPLPATVEHGDAPVTQPAD